MGNSDSDLKPKEAKVVAGILDGKSQTKAMIDAGYSESYAKKSSLKQKPRIKNALVKAMKREGIDEKRFAKVMSEGLSANKPVIERGKIVEMADHNARHRFLETGLKVSGYLQVDSVNVDVGLIVLPAEKSDQDWDKAAEEPIKVIEADVKHGPA
jgi:hypothetical protein